jgi:hypothetical protein
MLSPHVIPVNNFTNTTCATLTTTHASNNKCSNINTHERVLHFNSGETFQTSRHSAESIVLRNSYNLKSSSLLVTSLSMLPSLQVPRTDNKAD